MSAMSYVGTAGDCLSGVDWTRTRATDESDG